MRKYLLKPDSHDERDFMYKVTQTNLPESVDLRSSMPEIFDQGYLGSCTANAIIGLREFMMIKNGLTVDHLSRLFMYWHERDLEGNVGQDSGAMLRDGMKVLAKIGVCKEQYFPYDESKFRDKPTADAELSAMDYRIAEYHRVGEDEIFGALADGNPVVFGLTLWNSFERTGSDGIVPTPDPQIDKILGGHAMLAVGYKTINGQKWPIARNSWSKDWGDNGYCYLPPYYLGLITDAWTGIMKAKPEDFSFKESVNVLVQAGTIDSPDFWIAFEEKVQNGTVTSADCQNVLLEFRKFAAFIANKQGIEK